MFDDFFNKRIIKLLNYSFLKPFILVIKVSQQRKRAGSYSRSLLGAFIFCLSGQPVDHFRVFLFTLQPGSHSQPRMRLCFSKVPFLLVIIMHCWTIKVKRKIKKFFVSLLKISPVRYVINWNV